jgi:hypothetical protein
MEYINQLKEKPEPKTGNLVEIKIKDINEDINENDEYNTLNEEIDNSLNEFLEKLNNFKSVKDTRNNKGFIEENIQEKSIEDNIFFEEDEEIDFSIYLPEKNRVWSIKEQSDDLIHNFMSKTINKKKEKENLKKILNEIYYYKELRNSHSLFDDNHIPIVLKKTENINPLKEESTLHSNNYPWIVPVTDIKKKVYVYENEQKDIDKVKFNIPNIDYILYDMNDVDEEVHYDENYFRVMNDKFTPFVKPSRDQNYHSIAVNDTQSLVMYNDNFFSQKYLSAISNIRKKNNNDDVIKIFKEDDIYISGFITLPFTYSKYTSLYSPNSYIIEKSILSKELISTEKLVNNYFLNEMNVQKLYNPDIFKDIIHHEKKLSEYQTFFDYMIPSSKKIIDYCIKYIQNNNENLSLSNLLKYTKNYNLYKDSILYKDLEYLKQKISEKNETVKKLTDRLNKKFKTIKNIYMKSQKCVHRKNILQNIEINKIKDYDIQDIIEFFNETFLSSTKTYNECIKFINEHDNFNIISYILKFINTYHSTIDYEKMCGVVEEEGIEDNIQKMVEIYESNINMLILKMNVLIKKNNRYQNIIKFKTDEKYMKQLKLVDNIIVEDECKSPHANNLESILNIENKYRRSESIIHFINKYCRPATQQERLNHISYKFYYMCKESNCKLIPSFYYELAKAYLESPKTYDDMLNEIIKKQGKSENGIIICKYTGDVIRSTSYVYSFENMNDNDDDNTNDYETDELIEDKDENDFKLVNDEVNEINGEHESYTRKLDVEETTEIIDNNILNEDQQYKINETIEFYNNDYDKWFVGKIKSYNEGTYDIIHDKNVEEFVEPQFIRVVKEKDDIKLNAKSYCKSIITDYIDILSIPLKNEIDIIIEHSYRILNLRLMTDLYKWNNIEESNNKKEINKLKVVLLSVSLSMLYVMMYLKNIHLVEMKEYNLNKDDFKRFKKLIFNETITSKISNKYIDDYDLLNNKLFNLKDQELLLRFELIMNDDKIEKLIKEYEEDAEYQRNMIKSRHKKYTYLSPPMTKEEYIKVNKIESLDLNNIIDKINVNSYEKFMLLKNKIIEYSYGICQMVRDETANEHLLLRNYVENTCCTSNPKDNVIEMNNILEYLNDKNHNINNFIKISTTYNDFVNRLTNIKSVNNYRHIFDKDELLIESKEVDLTNDTIEKITQVINPLNEKDMDSISIFENLQEHYNKKLIQQSEDDDEDKNIFDTIDDRYRLDDLDIIELIKDNKNEEKEKTLTVLLNKLTSNLKDKCKKFFMFPNDLNIFLSPDFNKNKIQNFTNHIKQYMYINSNERINKTENQINAPKHWRMRKNDKIKLEELLKNNTNIYVADIDENLKLILQEGINCYLEYKHVIENIYSYDLSERIFYKYLLYIYLKILNVMIMKSNELEGNQKEKLISIFTEYATYYKNTKEINDINIDSVNKKILISKMEEKDRMVSKHDSMNTEQLTINTVHRSLKLGIWSVGVGNINKKIIEEF